jgi:hypothetical protein
MDFERDFRLCVTLRTCYKTSKIIESHRFIYIPISSNRMKKSFVFGNSLKRLLEIPEKAFLFPLWHSPSDNRSSVREERFLHRPELRTLLWCATIYRKPFESIKRERFAQQWKKMRLQLIFFANAEFDNFPYVTELSLIF